MKDGLMTKADVARVVGLTPAAVTAAALKGRLRVGGMTAGGVRLFTPEDVAQYARERAARRARAEQR